VEVGDDVPFFVPHKSRTGALWHLLNIQGEAILCVDKRVDEYD
jgi:hypothetical protein